MPTKADLQLRVDALENENHDLRRMLARAERELEGKLLPEELAPDGMTNSVKKWMLQYKLPWKYSGALIITSGLMSLVAASHTIFTQNAPVAGVRTRCETLLQSPPAPASLAANTQARAVHGI